MGAFPKADRKRAAEIAAAFNKAGAGEMSAVVRGPGSAQGQYGGVR
ncbi:hypothetical protein ACIA8R_44910 [Nonomuraea sp. NPDC051191]